MKKNLVAQATAIVAVTACATFAFTLSTPAHATFKCKGADGKIEYSDRACDTSKDTLDKPNGGKGVQSKPAGNPMEQMEKLFTDFEPRLCEREKVAAEIDRANRTGEFTKSPAIWKPKQDRLLELNEVMIDFQTRTGKITKVAGYESKEMLALRKFQVSLRDCGKLPEPPAPPPAPSKAPAPPPKK